MTALLDVVAEFVAREHPPGEGMETWTFEVNDQQATLVEDRSNLGVEP